jgi:ATP-dependent RNA helicase RhlE
MSFEQLGLQAELLQAVTQQGYTSPTPIQKKAIPMILEGRDILGGAQTGTGKTAAFALPILQLLGGRTAKGRQPRALILTPTRELAAQVAESVRTYGRGMRLRSTVIFGGVGFQQQIDALRRGVDILVATPGRLLDHINQKNADLSHVEILVLDEADRMLDMGFIHDIRKVLNQLPAERQSMLFSATYSDEVKELADGFMRTPELVEVGHRNTAVETVTQVMHPVARSSKRDLLTHLIKEGDWRQVLVFSRTKHGADRLAKGLEADGISATSIHGNKSQPARTKALADFKNGRVRILVATDIAARGLDIDGLPHVVNYELPNVPEDYIHRIGRTGRAGANGEAVSLVCADEMKLLDMIQRLTKREVEVVEIEGFKQEASASPQSAHRRGISLAAREERTRLRPERNRNVAPPPARRLADNAAVRTQRAGVPRERKPGPGPISRLRPGPANPETPGAKHVPTGELIAVETGAGNGWNRAAPNHGRVSGETNGANNGWRAARRIAGANTVRNGLESVGTTAGTTGDRAVGKRVKATGGPNAGAGTVPSIGPIPTGSRARARPGANRASALGEIRNVGTGQVVPTPPVSSPAWLPRPSRPGAQCPATLKKNPGKRPKSPNKSRSGNAGVGAARTPEACCKTRGIGPKTGYPRMKA